MAIGNSSMQHSWNDTRWICDVSFSDDSDSNAGSFCVCLLAILSLEAIHFPSLCLDFNGILCIHSQSHHTTARNTRLLLVRPYTENLYCIFRLF